MSKSRDLMIEAINEIVVPKLRDNGFSGSFPRYKRIRGRYIDMLGFQFNRYGGSFCIEIAKCGSGGLMTSRGIVPAKEVEVRDVSSNVHSKRQRLSPDIGNISNYWFRYDNKI